MVFEAHAVERDYTTIAAMNRVAAERLCDLMRQGFMKRIEPRRAVMSKAEVRAREARSEDRSPERQDVEADA
jgi:hypothetical protein